MYPDLGMASRCPTARPSGVHGDDHDDLMHSRFESIERCESAWSSLCCGKTACALLRLEDIACAWLLSGEARMHDSTWLVESKDAMHVGRRKAFDSVRQHSCARQHETVRRLDDTHLSLLLFPATQTAALCQSMSGPHTTQSALSSRPQSARWKHAVVSRLAAAQVHLGRDAKTHVWCFSSTVVIPDISLARYVHRDFAIGGGPLHKGRSAAVHVRVN